MAASKMSNSNLDLEKETTPAQIENVSNEGMNLPVEKSKAEKKLIRKIDALVPAVLNGAYFFAYLV